MSKKFVLLRLEELHDSLDLKWQKSKSKKNKAYLIGKMEGYSDAMFMIENMKYYKHNGFDLKQRNRENE